MAENKRTHSVRPIDISYDGDGKTEVMENSLKDLWD
jgi:hypothetical protein